MQRYGSIKMCFVHDDDDDIREQVEGSQMKAAVELGRTGALQTSLCSLYKQPAVS